MTNRSPLPAPAHGRVNEAPTAKPLTNEMPLPECPLPGLTDFAGMYTDNKNAILVLDAARQVMAANSIACNMLGYSQEELQGLPLNALAQALYTATPVPGSFAEEVSSTRSICYVERKNGSQFAAEVIASTLMPNSTGGSERVVLHNLTDPGQDSPTKVALQLSTYRTLDTEELRRISDNIPGGGTFQLRQSDDNVWVLDFGSPGYSRITGVTSGERATSARPLFGNVHADDWSGVAWELERSKQRRAQFDSTFRLARPGARTRWLHVRGVPALEPQDGMVWSGVALDVSERKRAEEALRTSETRSRLIIAAMAEGVVVVDERGRVVDCNASAQRILGARLADLFDGRARGLWWTVLREDGSLLPDHEHPVARALASGTLQANVVIGLHRDSGSRLWLSMSAQPLREGMRNRISGAVVTFTDITDRKRGDEMRAARDAAEAANVARSAAVARMSHDLRTPLNSILGFAQLIALDPDIAPHEGVRKKVAHIIDAGRHLRAVADDILDLSRIEAGVVQLTLESLDLSTTVRECITLAQPTLGDSGITIQSSGMGEAAWVRADRTRLRQILDNLLSNAVKYNRAGGTVDLSLEKDADFVVITVTDSGIGLTPQQLANLFEPFNRLGAETTHRQGTGIGLFIVKQLVTAMQGEISVASAPGVGSSFCVRFPSAAAPPLSRMSAPLLAECRLPAANNAPSTICRVLYVEDNPIDRELVETILGTRVGFAVQCAADGPTGIELATRWRPDLILLDIDLPLVDGYGVLKALRTRTETSSIPCVALSAYAMPTDLEQATAAGFCAYLTKPFELDKLLNMIGEHRRQGD